MSDGYMGPAGDQFAGADPRELERLRDWGHRGWNEAMKLQGQIDRLRQHAETSGEAMAALAAMVRKADAEVERLRTIIRDERDPECVGSLAFQLREALEGDLLSARVEQLEQALRETRDGLADLALWRDHSEAGCNACGKRAYNYDPVQHDARCAFLTIRAALHPDQQEEDQ